ncbi:MAG: hypothetical protein AAFW46_04670 [Pseudomonadota bacterium]
MNAYDIGAQQPVDHLDAGVEHILRRSGARPVSFRGVQICSAMSYTVGTPLWYEINLYRLQDQSFVVDVRMFTKSDEDSDKFTVQHVASFDEAVSALEAYDAAADVRVNVALDDPTASLADLTFQALAVRARVEEARAQYRGLVSQILSDLEQVSVEAAGGQRLVSHEMVA